MSGGNASRGSGRGARYGKTDYRYAMDGGGAQWLKCHADELAPLLDAEPPWRAAEVSVNKESLSAMADKNIVEQVDSMRVEGEYTTRNVGLWQLTAPARERLRDRINGEREAGLPCGHSGFINEGEELMCKTCEERFSKEEVG